MRIIRSRGLSLIETMVALVLLATTFVAVVSTLPALVESQMKAEELQLATALANDVMERARARPFPELTSIPQASLSVERRINGGRHIDHFLYGLDVLQTGDGLKACTVTVTWIERTSPCSLVIQTEIFGGADSLARR